MVRTNDLIATSSGLAHIGVDGGPNAGAFDIASLTPYGHIAQLSGIFCDPLLGQSGVIRFSHAAGAFQVSVDGGATFSNVDTGSDVDSVGVIGGANLVGDIDLASQASGFIAITDTAGASPINFAVDHLGLSGLWGFPTQGFNGSVVNELTDGTTAGQGSLLVAGASGITADVTGQTLTLTAGPSIAKCYSEAFASTTSVTVTHGLVLTRHPVVMVYDTVNRWIIPDRISVINANTVQVDFNVAQAGSVVVVGC